MRVGLSQDYALGMTGVESGDDRDCHMGHIGFKTWLQCMCCALTVMTSSKLNGFETVKFKSQINLSALSANLKV